MESFRDLLAWQKGMELVAAIYRVTDSFPRHELYGITQQMRRAALSVPSNIAEGKGRQTKRDYVQFLYRARGSLFELMTQLDAALRLNFIEPEAHQQTDKLAAETGRILNGLISNVERQIEHDAHPSSSS
jgi:four helix bundle protein